MQQCRKSSGKRSVLSRSVDEEKADRGPKFLNRELLDFLEGRESHFCRKEGQS